MSLCIASSVLGVLSQASVGGYDARRQRLFFALDSDRLPLSVLIEGVGRVNILLVEGHSVRLVTTIVPPVHLDFHLDGFDICQILRLLFQFQLSGGRERLLAPHVTHSFSLLRWW